jgi:chromosome segregation ATPase
MGIGLALPGCGTGGLAVKSDVWEAQQDFERRQASLSEKVLNLEGRIAVLEEENAALNFQLEGVSKQVSNLDSDLSRGLEAVRDGQQELGIELEKRIRTVDSDRADGQDDVLSRMEIILEEVTQENQRLRQEIETVRSSVGGGPTHTVQRGETLATIASQYGVTVADLVAANNIRNANIISVGQDLVIPGR